MRRDKLLDFREFCEQLCIHFIAEVRIVLVDCEKVNLLRKMSQKHCWMRSLITGIGRQGGLNEQS